MSRSDIDIGDKVINQRDINNIIKYGCLKIPMDTPQYIVESEYNDNKFRCRNTQTGVLIRISKSNLIKILEA
ncbi:hypothetical protein [Clostridium paraputrificum]|uniref:hypothetical protein n=1 Tax=Clostridium paraputrificum TaxID=29363 RepID=UPI00189E1FCF|nr:hypothetical protein [Clostridium paraputrificum]